MASWMLMYSVRLNREDLHGTANRGDVLHKKRGTKQGEHGAGEHERVGSRPVLLLFPVRNRESVPEGIPDIGGSEFGLHSLGMGEVCVQRLGWMNNPKSNL